MVDVMTLVESINSMTPEADTSPARARAEKIMADVLQAEERAAASQTQISDHLAASARLAQAAVREREEICSMLASISDTLARIEQRLEALEQNQLKAG